MHSSISFRDKVESTPAPAARAPSHDVAAEARPFVSVIIPVYEDADVLATCLEDLGRQTYPAHCFETLVVDNGSRQDLASIIADRPGVSLIRCATPGSYAARNRGVAAALGSILVFTDADCQPRPDWLESGVAALQGAPEIAVLGGAVEILRRQGAASAAELHQRQWAFPQEDFLTRSRFLVTANLFTHRSVFENVGPFDERLFSSGDLEWGQRAHAKGYRMILRRDVVTNHPPRATMPSLIRWQMRMVGGQFALRRLRGGGHLYAMVDIFRRPLRRTLGQRRPKNLPWRDRVRVAAVEWALAGVRLLELVRLFLGGTPRRR